MSISHWLNIAHKTRSIYRICENRNGISEALQQKKALSWGHSSHVSTNKSTNKQLQQKQSAHHTPPPRHTETDTVSLPPAFSPHCVVTGFQSINCIHSQLDCSHSRKRNNFSSYECELWPMTLIFKHDLERSNTEYSSLHANIQMQLLLLLFLFPFFQWIYTFNDILQFKAAAHYIHWCGVTPSFA